MINQLRFTHCQLQLLFKKTFFSQLHFFLNFSFIKNKFYSYQIEARFLLLSVEHIWKECVQILGLLKTQTPDCHFLSYIPK